MYIEFVLSLSINQVFTSLVYFQVYTDMDDRKEVESKGKIQVGVKRERSNSGNGVPSSSSLAFEPAHEDDVYKVLSRRMGGQVWLCFDKDVTTHHQPYFPSDVSIADLVPYMWKEKPLDATLKNILTHLTKSKKAAPDHLQIQVEQLSRMFSIMWNDCVFSGLSAGETLSKVSLDPQAWVISEAAMEVALIGYGSLKPRCRTRFS